MASKISFLFILVLLLPAAAYSLDCPKMPEQTNKDWDVEVKAAVGRIGPVKGAELETKTRSAVTDLMGKLPQADRIYLQQMMYATYCSGLRDDKTMSESEKAKLIRAYNLELQKALSGPSVKQKGPKTESKQDSNPEEARLALGRMSLPFTREAFIERAEENDTYAVKLYLAAGIDPDPPFMQGPGISALWYAVRNENRQLITALLEHGADMRIGNGGYSALDAAAARGMNDVVEMMLAKGPNDKTIGGAVISAAQYGRLDTLKLLLSRRGALNSYFPEALRSAASHYDRDGEQRQNEVVRFLIEQKVDIDSADSDGVTALMLAAQAGNTVITRTLLDAGASVNIKCACPMYLTEANALLMSLYQGHFDVAKILINRGADCTLVESRSGGTALTYAAEKGTGEIVSSLIDKGADPNKKNKDGKTPLMIAAMSGNADVVRMLVERGALLNEKDQRGRTAYAYAFDLGSGHPRKVDIVQLLQAAGGKQ